MPWYGILKLVHVMGAIIWIGGGAAFSMIVPRLVRSGDRATLTSLLPQVTRFMQTMAGPASALVLLTGIAIVFVGHMSFGALWISLGFAGFIIYALFGGLVMQKRAAALAEAVTSGDDAALARAGTRLRQASLMYLLLMTAIVAVMVLKPTI